MNTKQLQTLANEWLTALGSPLTPLAVDGIEGPKSRALFQALDQAISWENISPSALTLKSSLTLPIASPPSGTHLTVCPIWEQHPELKDKLIHGVDVSSCQPPHLVNWQDLAKGNEVSPPKEFTILKASEGQWKDPTFEAHRSGAKSAGLLVGAYHFARLSGDAKVQAGYFVSLCSDLDLPGALDLEWASENGWRGTVADIVFWAQTWVETYATKTGHYPILYSGPGYLSKLPIRADSILANCPLWAAHYGTNYPAPSSIWRNDWAIWQFAGNPIYKDTPNDKGESKKVLAARGGHSAGFGGDIDLDIFQGTREDLAQLKVRLARKP